MDEQKRGGRCRRELEVVGAVHPGKGIEQWELDAIIALRASPAPPPSTPAAAETRDAG